MARKIDDVSKGIRIKEDDVTVSILDSTRNKYMNEFGKDLSMRSVLEIVNSQFGVIEKGFLNRETIKFDHIGKFVYNSESKKVKKILETTSYEIRNEVSLPVIKINKNVTGTTHIESQSIPNSREAL